MRYLLVNTLGSRIQDWGEGGVEQWYHLNTGFSQFSKNSRTDVVPSEFFQVGVRKPSHHTMMWISHWMPATPRRRCDLGWVIFFKRGLFPSNDFRWWGNKPFIPEGDLGNRSPKRGRVFFPEKSTEERNSDACGCHASGSMFAMERVSWEADSETETDICVQGIY